MGTPKTKPILSSEITPEQIYLNRRLFMKGMSVLGSGLLLAACGRLSDFNPNALSPSTTATADELGDTLTSFESITNYNNYYEFGSDKQSPAERASKLRTSPWTVEFSGLVQRPMSFEI
jgi:sulfoxide reductase catalytic subunit YedY